MLNEKIALITGAAKGNIGEGIAKVMVEKGASVIILGRSNEIFECAKGIDPQVHAYQADITDFAQVKEVADDVLKSFGHLDILVNNAGVAQFINVQTMDDEILDRQWRTNVLGAWNCTKAFINNMIEQRYGRIINISSVTGTHVCDAGMMGYGMSKAALLSFTKTLAMDVAAYGITANAILPGYIYTSMLKKTVEKIRPEDPQSIVDGFISNIPTGRMGTPEDIGYLAAFLASDEASYITGTEHVVDGGSTIPETPPSLLKTF